jgi:hypothetical protein
MTSLPRAALLLAAMAACHGGGERAAAPPAAGPAALAWRADDPSPVVAEVNGEPIRADCVEAQAQAHHLPARAALDECIGFELLAQEARARGFSQHPEAQERARAEAVRAFIDGGFAAGFARPEDVPRADLEAAWKDPRVNARFNHPERRTAHYVRVPMPRDSAAGSPDDQSSHRIADAIYAAARSRHDLELPGFLAIAARAAGSVALGRSGPPLLLVPGAPVEPGVAQAVFALPAAGMVTPPVRNRDGWTLYLVVAVQPARKSTLAEAEPELRAMVFERARQRGFATWVDDLARRHRLGIFADRLALLPDWDQMPAVPE